MKTEDIIFVEFQIKKRKNIEYILINYYILASVIEITEENDLLKNILINYILASVISITEIIYEK